MKKNIFKVAMLIFSLALLAAFTFVKINLDVEFDKVVNDDNSKPLYENLSSLASSAFASGQTTVWVGYNLNVREKFKSSNILYGSRNTHTTINGDQKEIYTIEKKFFYKFEKGKDSPTGLLLQQNLYDNDLKGYLVWIKGVSTQRSLEAALTICKSKQDKRRFLPAVAFHPGEKASDYLFGEARDEKDQEEREGAIFWYAQTIAGDGLGKLPELERRHKTNKDKAALVFSYSTLGNKAAFEKVKGYALNSKNEDVAKAGIFWMSQFDKFDATPELKRLFHSREEIELKKEILFSLSQNNHKDSSEFLVEVATSNAAPELKKSAAFWLTQQDTIDVLPLFKKIFKEAKDREFKEGLLFNISQIEGKESFEFIKDIAKNSKDLELKENAIFWISQSTNEADALDFLKDIYRSEKNPGIREKVLFSVSQIDNEKAIDYLYEVIASEKDPEVLEEAVFYLSQVGDEAKAIKILSRLYSDKSGRELKESIIFALAQTDNKDSLRKLLDIAKTEKDKGLRKEAFFWLSQSAADESADEIENILSR